MTEQIKTWLANEAAKGRARAGRTSHTQPLREAMLRRILPWASIVLTIHSVIIVLLGMPATLKNLAGLLLLPAVCLMCTAWCLRWGQPQWRVPLATAMLFLGVAYAAVVPQQVLASRGGYSYYGGMITLTILMSGLLIGEFFVGIWTLICCLSFQFAINHAGGWTFNAGWSAVYVGAAWLVTLFSRHLEGLHEENRTAEERQRSAIVAERTGFARDIHGSLAAGFTGIMLQLIEAEQHIGKTEQARVHLDKARQLASNSLVEARRSVSRLRSTERAGENIYAAIEEIVRKLAAESGVHTETRLEGLPYVLREPCDATLLRIAQEVITNAMRGAGLAAIEVVLSYRTGSVVLEVSTSADFGIEGMRRQARDIGGEITIVNDAGRGTRVIVTVPNA